MRLAGLIVLVCVGLGFVEAAQLRFGGPEFSEPGWLLALSRSMPSWLLLVALSPVVVRLADRWPVRGPRWKAAVVLHVGFAFPFALTHLALTALWGTMRPGAVETDLPTALGWLVNRYLAYMLLTYAGLLGLVHAWRYREEVARSRADAGRLLDELEQARLQLEGGRIHPHFTFNTLTAITGLAIRGDQRGVVDTLGAFTELLRATLGERAEELVPLDRELELLDRYVDIQRARFGDRVRVAIEIDPDTRHVLVPALLLQPLVENAYRHGVGRRGSGGRILVRARRDAGGLELLVSDPGPGAAARGSTGEGYGIGLTATRARLQRHFGPEAALDLREGDGGAEVVVRLPAGRRGQLEWS